MTDIAGAIDLAKAIIGKARPTSTHNILLITDGSQTVSGDPVKAAKTAKASGIQIFVVGVGSGINPTVLQAIASEPKNTHYFQITNFDALANILNTIATYTCPEFSCDSVSPNYGPATGGTKVVISGTNLVGTSLKCKFGTSIVPAVSISNTQIYCLSPAGVLGQYVSLQISLDGGVKWIDQKCLFKYSTSKPDTCERWNQNCSFCISQPKCGWCSMNVTRNDDTLGPQCATRADNTKEFNCFGTFSTTQCTKGYICDLQTYTCKITTAGNGMTQQACMAQCG